MEKITENTILNIGDKITKGENVYRIIEILSQGEVGFNSPEMDVYEVENTHSNTRVNFYKTRLINEEYIKM